MARLDFTILGCGSSGGVPRIGGHWGDCDPTNPKNRRRRCSALVSLVDGDKATRVLIDTGPDMKDQLVDAGVGELDGVLFTHAHADHMHGLDDVRQIVFNTGRRLQVWADGDTSESLLSRFGYAFVQPKGSPYPPICELNTIDGPVTISGAAGDLVFTPFKANHGSIDALGFRVAGVAYLPDVAYLYDDAWKHLQGLDCWIVDALRRTPHPTHSHLSQTLEWIDKVQPKQAVLTNMHIDLDYETVAAETPDHIIPAYDGLTLSFEV